MKLHLYQEWQDSSKIQMVRNGTSDVSYIEEEITSEPGTVTNHQQGEAAMHLSEKLSEGD